jgi:L-threonylcarbamoyladenylate synthase
VSTSANLSGEPTPKFFEEISEEIKDKVDYIVDLEQEDHTPKKPSTIVKLGPSGQFEFIRK